MWRVVLLCTLALSDAAADRIGTRWQQTESPPPIDRLWGIGTTFYGAGAHGAYRSIDGGATWSEVMREPSTAVFGSGPDDVWIVQPRSLRHGSGKQWTTQPLYALSFGARMEGMWGTGRDLYVYGVDRSDGEPRGAILRSRDGGGSWRLESLPSVARIAGVWGSSATDVYAVGPGGILHSTGDGEWKAIRTGSLEAIWGTSATAIYAVGSGGTILAFDGKTWSSRSSGVRYTLSSITGSNGEILVGSPDGAPLRSGDGVTWKPLTAMVSRGEVSATGRGHVVVASSSGVAFLGDMPLPDAPPKLAQTSPLRYPDDPETVRSQLGEFAAAPHVKKLLELALAVVDKTAPAPSTRFPGEAAIAFGAIAKCGPAIDRARTPPSPIVVDLTCTTPCGGSVDPSVRWIARTPAGPLSGSFTATPGWCAQADVAPADLDRLYQALLWNRLAIERDKHKVDALAHYVLDGGREAQVFFELASALSRPVTWRGFFWSNATGDHVCTKARDVEEAGDRETTVKAAFDSYAKIAHCDVRPMLKAGHLACKYGWFHVVKSYYQHLPARMADQLLAVCATQGFDPRTP